MPRSISLKVISTLALVLNGGASSVVGNNSASVEVEDVPADKRGKTVSVSSFVQASSAIEQELLT